MLNWLDIIDSAIKRAETFSRYSKKHRRIWLKFLIDAAPYWGEACIFSQLEYVSAVNSSEYKQKLYSGLKYFCCEDQHDKST